VIAFLGVVGAAYYALRVFIGAMHNRVGKQVSSRAIALPEFAAIAPFVLVILVLAFYPQFGLRRSEPSLKAAIAPARLQQALGARLAQQVRPQQLPVKEASR
jgi:NADH-quinone oxidoreductase subunit M